MIRLSSMEEYDKVVEFDFSKRDNRFFSTVTNPEKKELEYSGSYSTIDGNFLALFRAEEKLYFRANEEYFLIVEGTRVEWNKGRERNSFKLKQNSELLYELEYTPPIIDPPLEDDLVSSFVEEEHFDFCLFVYNVVNNKKRRESFFSKRE